MQGNCATVEKKKKKAFENDLVKSMQAPLCVMMAYIYFI